MKKLSSVLEIVGGLLLLAAVLCAALIPAVRGRLHIFTPRLQGSLTVCDGDKELTRTFADDGGHGDHYWSLGGTELPVFVHLFNTNDWHVITMDFRVERSGSEWLVTGTVHLDGKKPQEYSDSVPVGNAIVINLVDDRQSGPGFGA